MFFVYILQSTQFSIFYVGHTDDLARRFQEHKAGRSNFTVSRGPWELVYVETFPTRAEAMKREREIKRRKSRRYIERLLELNNGAWKKLVDIKDLEVG